MENNNILLIEDEESIRETLKLNLEAEGYKVIDLERGDTLINEYKKNTYNLIVLDVMLPGKSGLELCIEIRKQDEMTPILFLTAKGTSQNIVEGLKSGADDYLVKPFNLDEFLIRVDKLIKKGNILRKMNQTEVQLIQIGEVEIDVDKYILTDKNKKEVQLSKKEIELIKLLYKNKGKVISRDVILDTIWGQDIFVSPRTIDNFIVSLRKHLEKDPKRPIYLESIRGVGYKLNIS